MSDYGFFKNCFRLAALLLLFSILSLDNMLLATDLFRYGTPFIRHFTKKEYKAGNQNWSIAQDKDGFIYIGNSNGLLQFDGNRWLKFSLPSGTIVRSILAYQNRIYCGSLGELGYWEKDESLNMQYTSLTHLLTDYDFGDQEIWWIAEFEGNIIFQSFSNTFLYDGQGIKIIISDRGVLFPPFKLNNRLFIQVLNAGLFEIIEDEPLFIPGSEMFVNQRINAILPFSKDDSFLIATLENGFYKYDGAEFSRWLIHNDQSVIRDQVNRGVKISENLFAFGTLLGGIYIINEDGVILNQIDKDKGLNNNTVLSFYMDLQKNLWVGLDNGIDLIKVNSPIYYNTDISGEIGSVYTSAIFKGDLYLGTNRGVFYTSINSEYRNNNDFTIIPGSQGQVWSLEVIDGKLFCGHNSTTYQIEDYQLKRLSNIAGGYQIKQYPYNEDFIIQGSYNGLIVYEKSGSEWAYSHRLNDFSKLSKFIEFERENVLWVAHTHRGLYRLELDNNLTEITEEREFSPNSKSYVNKLNQKLVISSDSGFHYYDDIQNTFFPLDSINKSLGKFAINSHIIPATDDCYWIFKDGDCARVVMDENQVSEMDDNILNDLSEFLIPGYEGINVIDSTFTIIYLDNGYAVHNSSWKDLSPDFDIPIYTRELTFESLAGDKFQNDNLNDGIPYRFNNLKLKVSYPDFTREKDLIYKLEGYDDRWYPLGSQGDVSLQNLPYGSYSIKIRPENAVSQNEKAISFVISPPWYKSNTARFVYVLFGLTAIVLIVLFNRRKIKRIHQKHEEERKRLLEKEAAENQRKLIEIRNENLRNELKLRNSRLAKSTFSLIHKNNTLISVKEELTKIKEELGVRFPSKHFNRLIKNIDSDLTSEKDWKLFEQSFSEVHENFLHKLKDEYPELTPADIQLCAYLKMNLSSKEIASLLNITVRGVEIRRYRLRKKLHLDHDTNLTEFIMGY